MSNYKNWYIQKEGVCIMKKSRLESLNSDIFNSLNPGEDAHFVAGDNNTFQVTSVVTGYSPTIQDGPADAPDVSIDPNFPFPPIG